MPSFPTTGRFARAALAGTCLAVSLPFGAAASLPTVTSVGTGPLLANPAGIALEAAGTLVVVDPRSRTVVRVDPATGNRTLLAGIVDWQSRIPHSVVVEPAGTILLGEKLPWGSPAALSRLDPLTGERVVVSGPVFGQPDRGTGPTMSFAAALALDAAGDVLIADVEDQALYRVHRVSGDRTVVSGCTFARGAVCEGAIVGAGPTVTRPGGVAVEPAGTILLAQPGLLLRVDPLSGDRTAVSGGAAGVGPALGTPGAVRREPAGTVLWADDDSRSLIRIDPLTGDRATVSSAARGSGPAPGAIADVVVDAAGMVTATDAGLGVVLRVDPITGDRAIASGGPLHAGPPLLCPSAVVVEGSGHLVVADRCADAVIRVDPATGERTVVSDASRGAGVPLDEPLDLGLEPSGDFVVLNQGAIVRVLAATGDRSIVSSDTAGSGGAFRGPSALAVAATGELFVGNDGAEVCIPAPWRFPPVLCFRTGISLMRVDPATGERAIVSGGGRGGRVGRGPKLHPFVELAVEHAGTVVAGIRGVEQAPLRRVDPETGDRTRVTRDRVDVLDVGFATGLAGDAAGRLWIADRDVVSFIDPADRIVVLVAGLRTGNNPNRGNGPLFEQAGDLALEAGGTLVVTDSHPGLPGVAAILRVDPATGDRVYVTR